MNPINHVAIIMDGNGRWGLKHKNNRNAGHKAGLNTVEKILKESINQKIKFLTLYAFSTENWKRPKKEINYLFNLLEFFLENRIEKLYRENIKLKIIGIKNFSKKNNKIENLETIIENQVINNFQSLILQSLDDYLLKRYPIKINEKVLNQIKKNI